MASLVQGGSGTSASGMLMKEGEPQFMFLSFSLSLKKFISPIFGHV